LINLWMRLLSFLFAFRYFASFASSALTVSLCCGRTSGPSLSSSCSRSRCACASVRRRSSL
jgi:hypothetical protein